MHWKMSSVKWQPFCQWGDELTHWGRVTHICVSKLTTIGSDNGLAPNHYLNQWWNIVNWTLRNNLQWNFNWNSNIFIRKNALENVVCEMASILSRPQCVNKPSHISHFLGSGKVKVAWLASACLSSAHQGFRWSAVPAGQDYHLGGPVSNSYYLIPGLKAGPLWHPAHSWHTTH